MRLIRILSAFALVGAALTLAAPTSAPLCLSWAVTSGTTYTLQYIKLSLTTTHKWSKISAAELSTC